MWISIDDDPRVIEIIYSKRKEKYQQKKWESEHIKKSYGGFFF